MLILTRRTEESIMIGDDIKVTVIDMGGGQVRLGVTAPKDVSIHRQEVYDRVQEEKACATKA